MAGDVFLAEKVIGFAAAKWKASSASACCAAKGTARCACQLLIRYPLHFSLWHSWVVLAASCPSMLMRIVVLGPYTTTFCHRGPMRHLHVLSQGVINQCLVAVAPCAQGAALPCPVDGALFDSADQVAQLASHLRHRSTPTIPEKYQDY